jgi:DNA-binding response OmpR family regulator
VDDEPEILSVLSDALTAAGHIVITAPSGTDGIARFRAAAFDAVLTDLGMADVSGWELARTVRTEGSAQVVLGLVTGWGATISEEMVVAHGVDFVISKPFDVDELVTKLNQAIDASGLTREKAASPSETHPT